MFCRVLGPLEVEVEGRVVDLGGPLPRRLVARLLLAEGSPVSDSALVELLWGAGEPAEAISGLRVMISRLRARFGLQGREVVPRVGSGYQFAVATESTDHGRLAILVAEGARLLAEGEAAKAIHAYESALLLWRGQPWPELGDALVASGPRARLVELREMAVEELQAARLELGDAATAVATLSEAVIEAPYRERRWELLALGLYRAGQQTQALAELRRVRTLMVQELGVEPGPAVRELEQRMLSHDPALLGRKSAPSERSETGELAGPRLGPSKPPSIARPLSSFVGRASQVTLLEQLLDEQRLVTVTGPAGVGKTRLALEHAADRQGNGRGEVWLARLADVHTAETVSTTVAGAIGLVGRTEDPLALTRRALADRTGLLVLDNCEHLLDAIGELALALLVGCPGVRVLATSRAPLRVDGEHVLPLDPLPVRDERGEDGAAVRLLADRVRQHRAGWNPIAGELDAAREICVMLDGLPLALELAAARERAFGLLHIAGHLRERLDVLGTTPKGTLSPHISLEAAIGWSIDQLDATDRALALQLWPFEGGFTWQAAQAVQATDGRGRPVLSVLASLLDRSVITSDTSGDSVRYRMLETIRRYCRDHDPHPSASQQAHTAWVRALVIEQVELVRGRHPSQDLRVLISELSNIRAALAHALRHDPAEALFIVGSLPFLWPSAGAIPEGMRLTRASLEACPEAPASLRADGLLALSLMAFHAGDATSAVRLADTAFDTLAEPTTEPLTSNALLFKALLYRTAGATDLGDVDLARATLDRFTEAARHHPVPDWIRANAWLCEGTLHLMTGDRSRGEAVLAHAREAAQRCGFFWAQATADLVLARSLLRGTTPDPDQVRRALAALSRSLPVFQAQANVMDQLAVLYAGAHAIALLGPADTAMRLRAAVTEHAGRTGVDLARQARLSGRAAEKRISSLSEGPEQVAAEQAGRDLSWSDMLKLFTHTAAELVPTTR